jgi:hypothetical protein
VFLLWQTKSICFWSTVEVSCGHFSSCLLSFELLKSAFMEELISI